MSIGKRIAICLFLLAVATIFWFVPDPIPFIDEVLATIGALVGISTQVRAIVTKRNTTQE